MSAFLAGVVAGFGIAMPVGPIAVLIAGLSARFSWRTGVAAGLGAATADGLYALAAVLGGAAVAALIVPVAGPLRTGSGVVLLALAGFTAWTALRRRGQPDADRPGTVAATPWRAYAGVLALTLLNPVTVVYFAALVLARVDDGGALFVVGAFLASASWQVLVACGGSLVGRVLTGPRGRLITALASSVVIAVLAGHLLLTG